MVPRIFGPYEPIRRDYPIEEFLADIAGSGVEKSVYVQTNWAKTGAVEEVEWVQGIADRAWLAACRRRLCRPARRQCRRHAEAAGALSADARHPHAAALARQRDVPLRRGARPDERPALPRESAPASPARAGRSTCRSSPRQMADAARLAADNPDIIFVLQHAGMLEDLSPDGRAAWRDGMKRLADAAEHRLEALRPRHLHPPQRPRAYQRCRAADGRAVRRRALPVRQQFPDREAVDELCRSRRRAPRGDRLAAGADQQAILARHRDARLPAS